MGDTERLVQRFIDQELSSDERIRFIVELGRSDALRREVVSLETLVRDASRLPRPVLPAGFVAGVMDRIDAEPAPAPATHRRAGPPPGFGSRGLAWALATAACALFAALGWYAGRGSTTTVAGPALPAQVLVRLVVVQPEARLVQVAGDFNGWNPEHTPLEPAGGGAWTVTLPLEPGRYQYKFVVDGQTWIADPYAAEQHDDGFGSSNAVLDVRATGAAL